ncbi:MULTISPECIES: cyclic nucleotide-binding domain-containing protein [Pseudanabaena]|uniref:Cyclic nucleotide-binding domain-containing protein n=2 Tax=Pseudanabaena TaxID=1152 RepID=A0A9X4MBE2_9CYAN|nr:MULTISPECIES: cyclic nucleotide-binding domain-containing protein [Pseudanabaena]ELS33160.1 putative transcriptional regulator, Crp/Fnr family [Pseudanabaena biceps PCC 7429]MDG3494636.1 cyclic nucleotide-binding domain-containing protein [Pseudanabaena catenata USMAC16]
MLSRLSEQKMHVIKVVLAVGWLLLILTLFYDPLSFYLTDPSNLHSPFRIDPNRYLDPSQCVKVQGICQPENPYGMGARIFWSIIIPAGLLTIFVFGHEVWRRICPLSFFSQIPRALGIQRKQKITSANGKTRYQLFSVDKNSWLGKNHLYLQFGLFFLGINIRILFVNSDRLALGIFFILTILAAISVGYLFAGKSWCQYFCPMAPVQVVFTGTRGLLDSQSHLGQKLGVTQSMCREFDKSTGKEKSACVACQNPCIDIDSERAYWEQIERPDRRLLYYGYLGLVFGFFFYYFLYAGNWDYLYSGIWSHEEGQISRIFGAGFYIFNQAIPIPKIIAAPLTLATFGFGTYILGGVSENIYRQYLQKKGKKLTNDQILHRIFTVFTVIAWNVFWIFISRPAPLERLLTGFTVLVSGLWFAQTFWRTSEQYEREGLANKLRRQLEKLGIDMSKFVQRGTDELKPDEVYILAKVLPEVTRDQRDKVYRGVLIEALEDGIISATEEKLLKELRKELEIDIDQHYSMLASLGIEDPTLFNPDKQFTLEKRLRLDAYRNNLEFLIFDLVDSGVPISEALERKKSRIDSLKQEYRISEEEEELIAAEILGEAGSLFNNAQQLLESLRDIHSQVMNLEDLPTDPQSSVYQLLRNILFDREKIVINKLMSIIEVLGDRPMVAQIVRAIDLLTPTCFRQVLDQKRNERLWSDRFNENVISWLAQSHDGEISATKTLPEDITASLISVLERFLHEDIEPLVQALSLEALRKLDVEKAQRAAVEIRQKGIDATSILAETADAIANNANNSSDRKILTTLEKTLYLFETRFFHHININTLIEIARYCEEKSFMQGEVLCRAGDVSNELLIIIDGQVDVIMQQEDGSSKVVNRCSHGETIGELGVLTQTNRSATVIAESGEASVLTLSDRNLDYLLKRNPLLSSTLLSIVSSRLQRILGQVQ